MRKGFTGEAFMTQLNLELSEEDLNGLKEIWEFNKSILTEEVLQELGWADFEIFCLDLLFYGFDKASDDPVVFIRELREYKTPIFKDSKDIRQEKKEKFREEFSKFYS